MRRTAGQGLLQRSEACCVWERWAAQQTDGWRVGNICDKGAAKHGRWATTGERTATLAVAGPCTLQPTVENREDGGTLLRGPV